MNCASRLPFKEVHDATDEAALFHVDLSLDSGNEVGVGTETEALSWLDATEQARYFRIRSVAVRHRFVLCRAVLRALLCNELNCTNDVLAFGTHAHGKPFATVGEVAVPVSFNVSHSGKHGLIAMTVSKTGRMPARVGVDVAERMPRKKLNHLIEGVFSPKEQAELQRLPDHLKLHTFYRFWTIKEALLKACGKGIALNLAELEVPALMRRGALCEVGQFPLISSASWQVTDVSTEYFAGAVAIECQDAT
ncbi:MAG: 4'-phosphopantetheinyl transferase superfamily protein [bacterium]|nr:4'-phosphopantetheinyl transferase superfamily protein [bacterium]MCY4257759.1 4'-phosphopantetheinyl transferase superfamily protein [bacterium]